MYGKYTDPSGEIIPVLVPVVVGIGAGTSAAVYSVATLVTQQQWDWKNFGRTVAIGAVGGAISGGLGGLSGVLGSFGNSAAYNILTQTTRGIVTNAMYGNKLNAGNLIGTVVSGILGASIPAYSGIDGNSFANALAEIGYSTLKGAMLGGISGSISGALNSNSSSIMQSVLIGGIMGALGGAFNVVVMGPAVPYNRLKPEYVEAIESVRDRAIKEHGLKNPGYPIVRHPWLHSQSMNLGRNILVNEYEDKVNDDGQLFHWNNDLSYRHETIHYYQQQGLGTYLFYSRIFYEWFKYEGMTTYHTPGTLEYRAEHETLQLY